MISAITLKMICWVNSEAPLKSNITLIFLKLLSWLPLTVSRRLGKFFGYMIIWLDLQPIRVARINLALCYPQLSAEQIETIGRGRMLHLGQALCETPRLWRKGNPWLGNKIIKVEGLDYLQSALANEHGTILLIPHQGNWEVIGLWISQQAAMTALYEPPKMSALEHYIKSSRERAGATLVPTNVRGVAALVKALKRGEVTAILPDQQPPEVSGEFAPIFGVPAQTMTLVHNLLQRSGSQALLCTALRVAGGWKIVFKPVAETIYSKDQHTSLQSMNEGVETIVDLAPDQYQWEYKRFRARPEGMPKLYSRVN